ncbi:MAG: YbhB/YbcL family Raf kinase inhibitor-like protein, partial [Rubrivivax sp.]|nr:YbhB/YbcL family Raf kinase inhibitor-like protein [Rubrivivax sp.]
MKLVSDSWTNGDRIPARYAAGRPDGRGGVTFGDNLNPHLAWSEAPAGALSMVLICHDFDVPSRGDDVNQPDREVPADLPRVDFFHWVLIDLPPQPTVIAEGQFSRGFTARGKPGPQSLHGARHGLNDYTGW